MSVEAVTWWGHATTTIELGGVRVATDPLLPRRLFHLRRALPEPPDEAVEADVVLVSHLHHDHLHLPSLRRFGQVPVVVPRGALAAVPALAATDCVEVAPGDRVTVAGIDVDVLAASHDGTRDKVSGRLGRRVVSAPALGFRFAVGPASVWYPGDTGVRADFADVAPVDLAVVPIGGWGPTLGEDHLDPEEAVAAVAAVGARWALAVHYGTYWPLALRRINPANHHRLFVTPPQRFRDAADAAAPGASALTPGFGERVPLDPSTPTPPT